VSDDWRFDLEPWPGPPDRADKLPWSDPFADVMTCFRQVRQNLGKSFSLLTFEAVMEALSEAARPDQPHEPRSKRIDLPVIQRNHGPRSNQTFTRNGRRRY